MKKKNLKNLNLNKKFISNFSKLSGGKHPPRPSDWCQSDDCTEDQVDNPPGSIPHSNCNCGGGSFLC